MKELDSQQKIFLELLKKYLRHEKLSKTESLDLYGRLYFLINNLVQELQNKKMITSITGENGYRWDILNLSQEDKKD